MTLWNFAYSELVKKEWDDSRFSHRARYTFVYRSSNFLPLQKDFSPGALLSRYVSHVDVAPVLSYFLSIEIARARSRSISALAAGRCGMVINWRAWLVSIAH